MEAGKRNIAIAAAALVLLAIVAIVVLGSAPKQAPPQANATPQPAAPEPQNLTPPANASPPPQPPPPEPPAAVTTGSSIGSLLDEGLARGDARFEAGKGQYVYDINAYRWRMSGSDSDPPDALPLKANDLNASLVRFPDRYIDSIRGFAFKTYQPQQLAGPMKLFGVAVFLSNSTVLDSFGNKSFDITYDPHPLLSQTLEGCNILNSTLYATPQGSDIKVYDFRCKIIYGASP